LCSLALSLPNNCSHSNLLQISLPSNIEWDHCHGRRSVSYQQPLKPTLPLYQDPLQILLANSPCRDNALGAGSAGTSLTDARVHLFIQSDSLVNHTCYRP
jgi:hypothetical protein